MLNTGLRYSSLLINYICQLIRFPEFYKKNLKRIIKTIRVANWGRMTTPANLRKKYNLYSGKKLKFDSYDEGIKIFPLVNSYELTINRGFLGSKGRLLKTLTEQNMRRSCIVQELVFLSFFLEYIT